jgi:putative transposase
MSRKTDYLLSTETSLHIANRGVDRTTIFFRPSDYEYFIELMARALPGSDLQLLLYVLMPNHFHMVVVQQVKYAVSFYMKEVCEAYAKYVNRWRGRSGHLFQDRFKIDMLPDPGALLRMSRYIHFNPVEARLAKSFCDWTFGSGRIYAGVEDSSFVDVEPILALVGGRERYLQFLEAYNPADPECVWRYVVR